MTLSTADILAALKGAELLGPGRELVYERVCTDTRAHCSNALFVALVGERFDGGRFLAEAGAAGALGAVIGPAAAKNSLPGGLQCFRVPDTLEALQGLADYNRRRYSGCRAVAVTGSNGKSTTKQLTASVCARKYTTLASRGNLNNHIGVPLTLLELQPETRVLVAEIGANHPGEIRRLASLVRPEVSVITNIAPTHLEGFGSLEGVLQAKLELFEQTAAGGTLIYNGDDPLLSGAVPGLPQNKVSFGLAPGNLVTASRTVLEKSGRPGFLLEPGGRRIRLPLYGEHNIYNALAAAAVGRVLGIGDEAIVEGLETASGLSMRMDLKKIGGLLVLDDSYNANPTSMEAALKTLAGIDHPGPGVAVLGEMLELGPDSGKLHRRLASRLAGLPLELVFFVGDQARAMAESYLAAGGDGKKVSVAADAAACWEQLQEKLHGDELLLVKGSRGIGLDYIVRQLEKESGKP
ncbi:MAG: UDP-N-acetylmuramoyl-tripeptide--D-alanyl-D-alanine ligase [Candidatus Glassbacteria bacterium]|nr:UDP-N-acetylmuramoyl-tripeptide--D-alanyl-D-alanine ligase [Candidatus Glassbacteria bacterium]